MRVIEFMVAGIGVPDKFGGDDAEIALGHAARSLSEFAIALDAFEEAGVAMDSARQAQQAAMHAGRRKVLVHDEHGARVEERIVIPDKVFQAVRYWDLRKTLFAKAAVIALEQIAQAIDHIEGPAEATTAAAALDAALPDLSVIRHSIAHADERAFRQARMGLRTYNLSIDESPMRLSTLLSDRGYCDGDVFVMKVARDGGQPDIARIEISQATLDKARRILQALISAVPWETLYSEPKPLFLRL